MSRIRRPGLAIAVILAGLALAPVATATPGPHADTGALRVSHAWIHLPPPGTATAAAYLTVSNRGRTPERLLGAVSPRVQAIEAHSMSVAGGVMRMRLLPRGFAITPGATLALAPGGDHLMVIGPRGPLRAGERVPVTLRFAHAGAVKIDFTVAADEPADTPAMPGMAMR